MMSARRFGLMLLASAALFPGVALAQMDSREGIDLQNQILELRRDIQQMQDSGAGGSNDAYRVPPPVAPGSGAASGGDLTPQLLERVQSLEDEVRTLRGRVDELQNQTQRQQADLSKQIGDMNFQMQQGGGHGAAPAPDGGADSGERSPPPGSLSLPSGGGSSGGQVPMPAARRTPEMALQEGNAALGRRDYAAADAAAHEVLQSGHGPRTVDAQFLLAQSASGQRNYQAAAVAYDDVYNRSHNGSHAQDSLYGLAQSLFSLGDKGATCGALNKLRSSFPALRPDIRDKAAGLRGRAGCG